MLIVVITFDKITQIIIKTKQTNAKLKQQIIDIL